MGKGIDLGRAEAPELAAVLDDFKDQLMIAMAKRLADSNGELVIPVKEIDGTGDTVLEFRIDQKLQKFIFQVRRKS